MTESCRESQPNTGAAQEKSATFKMEPLAKQTKEAFSFAANARKGLNKRVLSKSAKSGRHKTSETSPVGYETTGRRKEKWNCPVESKGYTLGVLFSSALEGRLQKGRSGKSFPPCSESYIRRARGSTGLFPKP